MASDMGSDKTGTTSSRADPRISAYLMIATYVVGGAGIGVGIYGLASGGGPATALHYALPLAVGAVGILALVRHSVFFASDTARAGVQTSPFYIIELGFANGAMGALALLAFFGKWGTSAESALMLAFALYLGLAFFVFLAHVRSEGLDSGKIFSLCMWLLQVGFMFYFGIAAAAAAGLPPF